MAEEKKRPGLKPGQRHSGQFVKGDPRRSNTGNRKHADIIDFRKKIMARSDAALEALDYLLDLNNKDISAKDRRETAELVLNHAHGRPVDRIAIATLDGNIDGPTANLDLPTLRQRAASLISRIDDAKDVTQVVDEQ